MPGDTQFSMTERIGGIKTTENKQDEFPRPCVRCGKEPAHEGHDACLGYIAGVSSVCCGHGITGKILI